MDPKFLYVMADTIAELRTERDDVAKQRDAAERKVEFLNRDNARLREDAARLRSDIEGLRSKGRGGLAGEELEEVRRILGGDTSHAPSVTAQHWVNRVDDLKRHAGLLKEAIDQKDKLYEELRQVVGCADEQTLAEGIHELKEERDNALAEVVRQKWVIAELEKDAARLVSERDELTTANKARCEQASKAEDQVKVLQEARGRLAERVDRQGKEIERLQGERNALRNDLEHVREDLNRLRLSGRGRGYDDTDGPDVAPLPIL